MFVQIRSSIEVATQGRRSRPRTIFFLLYLLFSFLSSESFLLKVSVHRSFQFLIRPIFHMATKGAKPAKVGGSSNAGNKPVSSPPTAVVNGESNGESSNVEIVKLAGGKPDQSHHNQAMDELKKNIDKTQAEVVSSTASVWCDKQESDMDGLQYALSNLCQLKDGLIQCIHRSRESSSHLKAMQCSSNPSVYFFLSTLVLPPSLFLAHQSTSRF